MLTDPSERRLIVKTQLESTIFLSLGLSTTSQVWLGRRASILASIAECHKSGLDPVIACQ
jgi:hypothetical protein